MRELEAASETTSDLLVNLFDGCMEAEDKRFRTWVTNLYDQWVDRRVVLDPNGLELMIRAENYYKD